jgi:excinuclease ABC subunit A
VRVRVDGTLYDLEQVPPLDGRSTHTIDAIVDRIIVREGSRSRLAESLQLAVKQGEGVVVAAVQAGTEWTDRLSSTRIPVPNEPGRDRARTFANSPYGSCPCEGLGYREQFDPELFVPDMSQSIASGAVTAGGKTGDRRQETGDRSKESAGSGGGVFGRTADFSRYAARTNAAVGA